MTNENKTAVVNAIWQNPKTAFGCDFKQQGQYKANLKGGDYDEAGKIRIRRTKSGENITVYYNGSSREDRSDVFTYLGQYRTQTGLNFKETLAELARIYGIELKFTKEERDAMRYKELAAEVAPVLIEQLRKHPDGTAARYIKDVRGFELSGKYFGELTAEAVAEVKAVLSARGKQYNPADLAALGITEKRAEEHYNVVLPYYLNGQIQGFVYRNTAEDCKPADRYKDSQGDIKNGYCDRLEYGTPAVLVEGELKALRLMTLGVKNVIAFGGQRPPKYLFTILRAYGITEAVYIPDNETAEDGHRKPGNVKIIRDCIKALQDGKDENGEPVIKSLLVADLPAPAPGGKVDADDYGREHPQELAALVELGAVDAWGWEFDRLGTEAPGKTPTQVQTDFEEIYNRYPAPFTRQRIQTEIGNHPETWEQYGITPASLEHLDEWQKGREYNNRVRREADALAEAVRNGANPATVAGIVRRLSEAQHSNSRDAWAEQMQKPFTAQLEAIKDQPDTIPTKWQLYYIPKGSHDAKEGERVEFWPADITIFCAATSHGKTSILVQTALDLIKTTDKTYLYVSVEENARQLLERFLNVYLPIKTRNAEELTNGKDTDGAYCFKRRTRKKAIKAALRGFYSNEDYPAEQAGLNEHFAALSAMIHQGAEEYGRKVAPRLKLIYTEATAESICTNIKYFVGKLRDEGRDVGAVFLDYMQLLTAEADEFSRHDEIKTICKALKDCAAEVEIPLVVASQLNRNALKHSGADAGIDNITVANIAEGADIERIAHDIYFVWQVSKTPLQPYRDKDGKINPADVARGFRSARLFETPRSKKGGAIITDKTPQLKNGYLYVEQLKARDGEAGGWAMLPYDGEAGTIGETDKNKVTEYEKEGK